MWRLKWEYLDILEAYCWHIYSPEGTFRGLLLPDETLERAITVVNGFIRDYIE